MILAKGYVKEAKSGYKIPVLKMGVMKRCSVWKEKGMIKRDYGGSHWREVTQSLGSPCHWGRCWRQLNKTQPEGPDKDWSSVPKWNLFRMVSALTLAGQQTRHRMYCWSYWRCQLSHYILLCTLFVEPRVGKTQAKRLEEDLRSHTNCGNPLQSSCLENPMDRGAWGATVHGVSESDPTEATAQMGLQLLHF